MINYDVITFKLPNGKSPFKEWYNSLDSIIQRRIEKRIARLRRGNFGDHKNLGDDLLELRLFFGAGYRIYCTVSENVIVVLLSGGDKSNQTKDIQNAKEYLKNFIEVKNVKD